MLIRSVSDITAYIKALLDGDELLADLARRRGLEFTRAASGHLYLTLERRLRRDALCDVAQPGCSLGFCAASRATGLSAWLHLGLRARRAYQFYYDLLRPAGIGVLWQQFQALKDRLQAEGLFDPARTRAVALVGHSASGS